nr:pyridoxal-5-phosphate-dependent protein subunit beta [Candidatus Krumholzibacteria bacterium]
LRAERGAYTREQALRDHARWLAGITPDYVRELSYHDRKTLHNFKYFTWVEQQGRSVDELRQLWDRDFWTETFNVTEHWDRRIEEFNERVKMA